MDKNLKKKYVSKGGFTHAQKNFVGGFTLVETLVAISILIVAITTMLGIAAQGLSINP